MKTKSITIAAAFFCFLDLYVFAGEYETAKEHENAFNPIIAENEIHQKKKIPFYDVSQWHPTKEILMKIPEESSGFFLSKKKSQNVEIKESKNPGENTSLGFAGTFVKVSKSEEQIDGTLILPIKNINKGLVDVRRAFIFRWDERLKQFIKMSRSGVSNDGKYVWSRITRPGDYAIIGLSSNRRIQAVTRSICASEGLPSHTSLSVQEICRAIACRGDQQLGGRPPLPEDPASDDICQRCLHLEGIRLPECNLEHLPLPDLRLNKWQSLGPFNLGGVVTHMKLDPKNPNKIYALSDPGGLWVLDNILNYPSFTWRPLTDRTDNLDVVGLQTFTLAVDDNSTIVYLADSFNNLFRSEDGGASWNPLGAIATLGRGRRMVRKLIVNPDNYKEIYAVTLSGLFLSIDGGSNWEPSLRNATILDAAIDFDGPPIIYIAERTTGFFKRNEQGNWESIFNTAQLAPGRPDEKDSFELTLRIAIGHRNPNGTKQTDADRLVAVKVLTIRTLADGTKQELGTVYTKRNNEVDWKRRGWRSVIPTDANLVSDKSVLAVSPHNSDLIIEGGISLWQSSNGGSSWNPTGETRHDHLCVAFDPRYDKIVYVSTDGGIYRSENYGENYNHNHFTAPSYQDFEKRRNLNKGLVTAPIYRAGVNGQFVLATIDHWHWWGTSNLDSGIWNWAEGFEWYPVYADPKLDRSGRFYGFFYKLGMSPRLVITRFNSYGIPETKLFGDFMPWTKVRSAPSAVGTIAVDLNSNTILVGAREENTDEYKLMVTYEGDLDPVIQGDMIEGNLLKPCWRKIKEFGSDPVAAIAYDPSEKGQAYVMTYSGVTYKSIDVNAYKDFEEVGRWELERDCYPNTETSGVRQLVVNSKGELFAISQCSNPDLVHCNRFARSFDGGENWKVIDNNSQPSSIYHSLLVDNNDPWTLYLSTQNGVYISTDRGEAWERFDSGLPNVEILQLLKDGNRIYAVTYGRGLWYIEPSTW